MSKWTAFISVLSIFLVSPLHAGAVEYLGTIPVVISADEVNKSPMLDYNQHTVFVQHIRLSDTAQQVLKERLDALALEQVSPLTRFKSNNKVPARIDLGMNGTPVLNQGEHGSCVTFAATGALDAVLGKGDYISQLCSLELGEYLTQRGKSEYSGWDGSFGTVVLTQLQDYGIVTKAYQQEMGCAGVKRYPLSNEKNTGKPMPISEYSANAMALAEFAAWENLVDMEQAFSHNHNPSTLLRKVKKHLREGKRITFGILLDVSQGHVGALGSFQKNFDTWILTPKIIENGKKGKIKAGHEMIIIGYDDEAEVRTQKGEISKGVFILRNSWGKQVGDKGNYYVSYDYFKAFSDEAQVIVPVN